ncbi:MAG: GldG family protein [Proteobacteria bacterium]|nr:GldG family protein [Pseudomonadota bacterium]
MGNFSKKQKYFKFILYIAVIVLINLVGITLFFRSDLTQSKIYSLSSASKDVVATLSEPLSIKVFFSKDLPTPYNNTERYLRDLLDEYASKGGKYFNYRFYNVSTEEGGLTQTTDNNRETAKSYGIQPVQIRIVENDEVKFKNAYMGLVLIHGDLIEKIPAITSTDGLEYQLTTAIQKLNNKVSTYLSLKDKVKVKLYLSSSLNDIAPLISLEQLPMLGGQVSDAIKQLNNKSLGIIDFQHIDISNKDELGPIAKKYDLMALSWPAVPEKNITSGNGAAGLVMEYQGKTATIPLISAVEIPIIGTTYQMADPSRLEEELTDVLEKMIGINKDIGFLADHGTHTLTPDRLAMMQGRPGGGMQAFNSLLESRYSIKNIDLKDNPIPEGLNCLIIARPTEPFTEYELFQIDQALMKGTNIAFISDSFNEVMPQQGGFGGPQYNPIDTGLEKLLSHYGVNINKAYVLDKQSYKHQMPANQGGGEQVIYFAPMILEKTINTEPEFMDNIKGLVTMQISPLELEKEVLEKNKIKATKLFSSSDESWLMEGNINLDPMFISPPASDEEMSSYDLAYILEGEFTSYFIGKNIPEKKLNEKEIEEGNLSDTEKEIGSVLPKGITAENKFLEISKPAKIFIMASSQMLQDNMLDTQGRSTNATFILNVIDHLNGEDKIAQMRSKQQTLNPIAQTTPFVKGLIKSFNIIALPIIVALFGFGVLLKRNRRKKKIAKRFEDRKDQ